MQEKIIDTLERATGWLTENAIADLVGARSAANIALHLKGMGNRVVSRKSPTETYPGTKRPMVEWRHADYVKGVPQEAAKAEPAAIAAPAQRTVRQPKAPDAEKPPRQPRKAAATSAEPQGETTIAGHRIDDVVERLEELKNWKAMAERLGCANPQEVSAKVVLLQEDLAQEKCAVGLWKAAAETLEAKVATLAAEVSQAVDVKDIAKGYRLRAGKRVAYRKHPEDAVKTARQMASKSNCSCEVIAEVKVGTARPFRDAKFFEIDRKPKPTQPAPITESEGGHPD